MFDVSNSRSDSLFVFVASFPPVSSQRRVFVHSRGRPFDTINPQFVSPPPLTLHFTFPAFPLRVQHSVGPSCVEASLSASRRCHRNLVRHRRLWAPSTKICMLCLQRNREQELWGNLRVHEHRRHGKWQRLIWKIKSCFESDDAAARVSFCINNSF